MDDDDAKEDLKEDLQIHILTPQTEVRSKRLAHVELITGALTTPLACIHSHWPTLCRMYIVCADSEI